MEPEIPSDPQPSTRKRMIVMVLVVGLLLGLLVGFNIFKNIMVGRALQGGQEPPQTVTTTQVHEERWQPTLGAVGTLRAIHGADLAFEVSGVVVKVEAVAGALVRPGQNLVSLNDDVEQAQYRALQAAADLAKLTFRRAKEQLEARTISSADYDGLEADLKAKEAAAKAELALAAKKHLIAPFAGRVGIITTSEGAYVTPGIAVASVQQLDQVYVDFALPQREVANVKPGQKVDLSLDAYAGRVFKGKVTAVNPRVDGATRNIQVEATIANPGHALVPGMFASVSMEVSTPQSYLTLPQTAVTYNPYGSVVFLAVQSPGGLRAQEVFVTTGPTRGDQVAILKGLEAGAQVVTSGGLKLRNGTPLVVDNKVQPASDPHPAPQEQ
jgi:membrane fusion protein (multidrug efflux system)